jgi:autotransporter-associated beta strand protein
MWIDGAGPDNVTGAKLLVENNFNQGTVYRSSGPVTLSPGLHSIAIAYYNGGGGANMYVNWDLTGNTPASYLSGTAAGTPIPMGAFYANSLGVTNVIKNGSGIGVLGGNNTYSGSTTINGGTLQVSSDKNLGVSTGQVNLNGGILDFTGSSAATARTMTAGAPGSGIGVETAGSTITDSGVIIGSGALTKTGLGSLVLTSSNGFSGGTIVSAGTLVAASQGALGSGLVNLAGGTLSLQPTGPVQQAIPAIGYNQDVIWGKSELGPVGGTSAAYDNTGRVLYEAGSLFAPAGTGLPHSGQILSATNPAIVFQFQPYNANNALQFTDNATSQTLTLTTPLPFSSLNVLSGSAGGSTYNMTLNFTDGSSDQVASGVNVPDRAVITGGATGFVGDMSRSDAASNYNQSANLFEQDFTLSAADQAKTLKSVTFAQTSGSVLDIFALSGKSLPAAVANYPNPINVTASSTLDNPTKPAATGPVTFQAGATLKVTGNQPVTLGSTTITGPATLPGAAKTIAVVPSATTAQPGTPGTFTVTAVDANGFLALNYTGKVHFTSSDATAVLPADATLTGSTGTFTVTFKTAGPQTLTATDTTAASITGTSTGVNVGGGTPTITTTHFLITGAPSASTPGTAFSVTVTALDASNSTQTSYAGTVHFSSTDGAAVLPADLTLTGGSKVFSITLKTAGAQTLTVSDPATGITGSTGIIQNGTGGGTGTPALSYFKVSTPTGAQTTGTPFAVTVTAVDASGATFASYNGKVHFSSSDAGAVLPADVNLTNGVGTFNVTLKSGGNQTITVSDLASLTTPPLVTGTTAAISARGLTVTGFTPTATGFTVTFSKPIVNSDVYLFGGTVKTPIQNVTVVGKSTGNVLGAVNGIFVIDPSGTSATFKASTDWLMNIAGQTDGLLPNDTWSVTLQSGTGTGANANGFFDALGAPLDGGNSGGTANYTTTFVTSNDGKTALTIPDFARGPDGANPIKVPNNSAKGIAVTLAAAAAGTKDVIFTLHYNPALLTVTGASTGDSSGTGSTFTAGTPANGAVTFTWHNGTGLSGDIVLGDIVATVPNSAANLYKAKDLMTIDNITVNGTALTLTSSAVHINAYFGDLSGDGQITGLDLANASNVAAGADASPKGLSAYRLVDPGMIGDIGANGSIDSAAISSLAGYLAHVNTPGIPTPASGLTITPGGPDPVLSLAVSQVSRGVVDVPVLLDQARPDGSTGMTEAIIGLTYDPKALTVSPTDITLGSLLASNSGWWLVSVVDAATGQIAIDLYSTTAITQAQAGTLVNIAFHTAPGAYVPATAVQLVDSVTPQGHWFSTEVVDAEDKFVLSPGVDRIMIPTGAPLAVPVSTTVVAPVSVENGPALSANLTGNAEKATSVDVEARDVLLISNGPLAAQPAEPHTLPASPAIAAAPAFQMLQLTILPVSSAIMSGIAPQQLTDALFSGLTRWQHEAEQAPGSTSSKALLGQDWLPTPTEAPFQATAETSITVPALQGDAAGRERIAVVNELFTQMGDEWDDFSDLLSD